MMNKRVGKFMQWTNEKLGKEQLTQSSSDFKQLEQEVNKRQNGTEKLQESGSAYIKSLARKKETDELSKGMAIAVLAQTMLDFGKELGSASPYGSFLCSYGDTLYSMSRIQDSFCRSAQVTLLGPLEKALVQMKAYQAAKRKLEGRRLALDAAQSKQSKLKREDSKVEEEVRLARFKYDETHEDVIAKMDAIQESESLHLQSFGKFMEIQATYYEECAAEMRKISEDWTNNYADLASSPPSNVVRPSLSKTPSSITVQADRGEAQRPSFSRTTSSMSQSSSRAMNELRDQMQAQRLAEAGSTPPPPASKPTSRRPSALGNSNAKLMQAVFEFVPEGKTELRLDVGDFISVLEEHESGWWLGELCDEQGNAVKFGGRSGFFPMNHAKEVSSSSGMLRPTLPSRPTSRSISSVNSDNERPPYEAIESERLMTPSMSRARSSSNQSQKSPLAVRTNSSSSTSMMGSTTPLKKRPPPPPPPMRSR